MEHTEYYQLSLWEQDDRIQMEDFNSNNAKIDAALAGGAKIATGSYTGTGQYGASHPNTLTFDFAPKLVLISQADNEVRSSMLLISGQTRGGLFPNYGSSSGNVIKNYISWSGTSVSWYAERNESDQQLNAGGVRYLYLAIG